MNRQLDTVLAEARRRNLSLAAALEWLTDLELEERQGRSSDAASFDAAIDRGSLE
jgi:hypothetical protein